MPQARLGEDGTPELGVVPVDANRVRARAEDRDVEAWHRACDSLKGKAIAAANNGDMAVAKVYRHLLKVAANSRELVYASWLMRNNLV